MKGQKGAPVSARASDLLRLCMNRGFFAGGFLTEEEQDELSSALNALKKEYSFSYAFIGGTGGCERKVPVLLDGKDREDFCKFSDISFLYIERADKVPPDHRSVLGSILGLGLERETVGDIFPYENGMAAAVKSRIAPFLLDELQRVGREPVKVSPLSLPEDFKIEKKTEKIDVNVPSPRLDCVIGALLKSSREDAAEYVKAGMVQINHKVVLQPDKKLSENDLLSLRGKGRYLISGDQRTTKSGRLFLTVLHYL